MLQISRPLLVLTVAALFASAGSGSTQTMGTTVGPDPAPLGCPISITVSNDNPFFAGIGGCSFEVYDDQQQLVYQPSCPGFAIDVGPYGWLTYTWNQTDQLGQQVAPGTYWVRVSYEPGFGDPTFHPIDVGGTDAGLVFEGTATIGQNIVGQPRNFYLCAPQDGGRPFFLLASLGSTGIPTCGGTLPLDVDALFALTLTPNTLFQGSQGVLPPSGSTKAPTFPLPEEPALVGLSLVAAYVVLDVTQPCPIRRISEPYALTIIG